MPAQRRGGVSYERQDRSAVYVRMLGDVRIRTKPELVHRERRRCSLLDIDFRLLDSVDLNISRQRLGGKFLSLQRLRRRRRAGMRFSRDTSSILDDHYGGQSVCLLSTVGDWGFNIFSLDKLTNGRPLFHICLHLFQHHKLIDAFHLDIVKLMRCLSLIGEGYHSNNPYHNATHAADVTQAMHCYLTENKIAQCVSPLEKMIALLSAATHDLDHPGVNQGFLIATTNPLATLYKNTSVLENHHWRSAIAIFRESGVFDHLDSSIWETIEWQLKSLILATDITRQQEFICRFKRHLDNDDFVLEDRGHRHFMLQIALKCADICNPCRPWELSKRWSEQVCDEFFQQGDYERKLQLPVTPNCDRYKTTVARIQSGFMKFVVQPLFLEWHRFTATNLSSTMLANININKTNWDAIIAEAESEIKPASTDCSDSTEEDLTEEITERSDDIKVEQREDIQVVTVDIEPQPERLRTLVIRDNPCYDDEDEKENEVVEVHVENIPSDCEDEAEPKFEISCDELIPSCQPRRHSLPPPSLKKDMKELFPRRGSFPKTRLTRDQDGHRRHSLPQTLKLPSSSVERLQRLASLAETSPHLTDTEDDSEPIDMTTYRARFSSLPSEPDTRHIVLTVAKSALGNEQIAQRNSIPRQLRHRNSDSDVLSHAQTFHLRAVNTFGNRGNGGIRQALRPLNSNSQNSQVPSRRRSGSEDANVIGARIRTLRGRVFERSRSLSLDVESQPLLRIMSEQSSTFSGASYDVDDRGGLRMTADGNIYADNADIIPGSPLLEEEIGVTSHLLSDRTLSRELLPAPPNQ